MRFWNPESGKQITSQKIDDLTEGNTVENLQVFIYIQLPGDSFNQCLI